MEENWQAGKIGNFTASISVYIFSCNVRGQ
jgi:hypothetical protein